MRLTRSVVALIGITATAMVASSCSRAQSAPQKQSDTAFAEMQKRGQMAMGVDQYTSAHKFDITPEGGRIELQRDKPDSLGVAQIRAHMRLIQHAFEAGDFSTPAFVHMRDMPGTAVMAARRAAIKYTYAELPLGAEVRISTTDPAAKAAIVEFMNAQRMEHHTGGMNMK